MLLAALTMPRKFRFILRKNHEKKRKLSACRNALVQATENPDMTVSLPFEIFEISPATSLQSGIALWKFAARKWYNIYNYYEIIIIAIMK